MDLKGQGSVLGFLLCFLTQVGSFCCQRWLATHPQATLLPQPLEARANLFCLGLGFFSAGSPSMIREQTPLLPSVASLLGTPQRCVKPCKSLHVYN